MREKPFKPFRINTSDGKSYDIVHPEMILINKNRVTVAIYDEGEVPGEDLPSREAIISPLHVASVEDVPPPRSRPRRRSA